MPVFRSALLRFADDGTALYDADGLLAVGPDAQGRQRVLAAGAWSDLAPRFGSGPVEHLPGRIIAPGFVDMHIHFPQTDVDRKSTRLNSSHIQKSRMPSSA